MNSKGFTLVEILIVVVILGILAAIVIPSFNDASSESIHKNLLANLQTVRVQIQYYKVHHNDLYPGQTTDGGGVVAADFISSLTEKGGDGYGPYLDKMAKNPYVAVNANKTTVTCVNDDAATPTGSEGTAWWFNAATGDFRACDSVDHIGD